MKEYDLIATATFGLEGIVKKELKRLGYHDLKVQNGKVEFKGTAKDICKSNIWLRCADRVLLKVGEFKATSFDELFEKTKALPWSDIIPQDGNFPVAKVSSVKSLLFSKSDSQAIVKKAVVESLKRDYNEEWFSETGAEYSIQIKILNDIVTLTIDTSGEGLHKRGYRQKGNIAPIKETLAAALVQLSGWRANEPLLDPMCGTGTILIEAAMIARNMAPGSNRKFVSEGWDIIPEDDWIDARDEAYSKEIEDLECLIMGSDQDEEALKIAKENIELAGVEDLITLNKVDAIKLIPKKNRGKIITNPPYGDRISTKRKVEKLYTDLGKGFKRNFARWEYFVITPNEKFEELFGKKAVKNRKLYNGRIKCYFYQYDNKMANK
ncbi:MAG: RNA methyltransferase [Fusobacteriia bacterium 4572_132]|nr:MAG: RNA methyltransferase [Fusobacteriia bacterium 4572_132]